MDINMPVMDGNEATKKIRELLQAHARWNPFIVTLTAYNEQSNKEQALAMGANCFEKKPIAIKTLIQVFQRAIALKK